MKENEKPNELLLNKYEMLKEYLNSLNLPWKFSYTITYRRMKFSKKLIFLSNLTITRAQKNLYHNRVIECRPVGRRFMNTGL